MIYKCSVCGKEYNFAADCEACEAFHNTIAQRNVVVKLIWRQDNSSCEFDVHQVEADDLTRLLRNGGYDCIVHDYIGKSLDQEWFMLSCDNAVNAAKRALCRYVLGELDTARINTLGKLEDIDTKIRKLCNLLNKETADAEH